MAHGRCTPDLVQGHVGRTGELTLITAKEHCGRSIMAHGRAEELTGRRRYRLIVTPPPYSSKDLALQVEVSVFANTEEGKPGRWVTEWRDATPADVAEQELVS